jgi:hypothetical protein
MAGTYVPDPQLSQDRINVGLADATHQFPCNQQSASACVDYDGKIYSHDRVWIAIDNPKGLVPAIIARKLLFHVITSATKYMKLARRRPGRLRSPERT